MTRIKRDCLRALGEDWFLEPASTGRTKLVFRHKPTGGTVLCGPSPSSHDEAVRLVARQAKRLLAAPQLAGFQKLRSARNQPLA